SIDLLLLFILFPYTTLFQSLQAKRWENTVTRPEIQKFAGSLDGQRARKGVFITTSSFSDGAKDFVPMIDKKIILIDGDTLSEYKIGRASCRESGNDRGVVWT